MNFDKQKIAEMVRSMAARMLPGWSYELIFAASVDEIGCLGMIEPLPQRKQFKMWIAPHPPSERYEETIAHELTHGVLSPLTHLLPPSGSVVMIEEMIVEPLGIELAKLLDAVPQYARAVLRALQNPRTNSPALRKRISALAIGRRTETRKRMDPKALAALAMEGGQFAAMDGLPSEVAEWIKKVIEAMAGGGAEPASRETEPGDGKEPVAMREEEMPPTMRKYARSMQRTAAVSLSSAIRLRIHEARTVDGLTLTPAVESKLAACNSIESFESAFELVKLAQGDGAQRQRSGALPPENKGTQKKGPSVDEMTKSGIPSKLAQAIHEEFQTDEKSGQKMLSTARQRLAREASKTGGK